MSGSGEPYLPRREDVSPGPRMSLGSPGRRSGVGLKRRYVMVIREMSWEECLRVLAGARVARLACA